MKNIQIEKDIFDLLRSRAATPDESLASILRRELHVPQEEVSVDVDEQTYDFLARKAVSLGESASSILRRELHLGGGGPSPPPPPPAQTIDFFLPGNGAGSPWNTRETAIRARVGDTLMVHNGQPVIFSLVNAPGAPFQLSNHQFPPVSDTALQLVGRYDPDVDGPLNGQAAAFWIYVT